MKKKLAVKVTLSGVSILIFILAVMFLGKYDLPVYAVIIVPVLSFVAGMLSRLSVGWRYKK